MLRPGPGAGAAAFLARGATHGPELHRPAVRRSCRPSRARWSGPGRDGPGQPLSLVQAQAGLQGAFRLPRRVRHARHGREDLDGLPGPGRVSDQASDRSRAGRASVTSSSRASSGARCRLRPGDLLYLPRGQYHYALADDGPCVHIAWGVTYPIGMDVVSYAFERMVGEAVGRANLPRDRAGVAGAPGRDRPDACAQTLAEPQAVEDMLRLSAPPSAGRANATTCPG